MSPADGSSGVDGSRTWRQQWQPRRPNERWRQAEFSSAGMLLLDGLMGDLCFVIWRMLLDKSMVVWG
ncbi:hypothetical protein OsJ_03120 [Oryza sativa Japonica Group]|uniref:Uncharacterized protein n=1 Tax=Oryza sativa subsp. japonica TaxID=39947 RepID=B9EYZ6_ORYSJ|nr:hypothetical protein OsJ_03120 [Oryza sativa Japonica Group]